MVRLGSVEELGLDPVGADGHHTNTARLPLDVERAGEGQHERLGRGVDVDAGNGLEGRQRAQLIDAATCLQIGQRDVGHGHQRAGVEIDLCCTDVEEAMQICNGVK